MDTILFDLDDTLTDANGFASGVLTAAAARHGFVLDPAAVGAHPGAPYVPLLCAELGVDRPIAEAIYADYVARYRDEMSADLHERPGAGEVLRVIAARGARLALVTNKLEVLAREILQQFGWASLFSAVIGQDTCAYHKPQPQIIHFALDALGGRVEDATFVGDTPPDMQCGREAGVPRVIGLLGTTAAAALTEAGATRIARDLAEVRRLLAPETVL
ncbi:MAG: HAD family hydrolase [Dehalococcoidia bacterium]